MRKLIFLFLLSLAFTTKAQTGYEQYYSEKDLRSNLEQAKTLPGQLDATGSLAMCYKYRYEDSIARLYIKKVYTIAENSKDPQLMARALWWDNLCEESIEKANKYLSYAGQHNLVKEKIFAYLSLSDIYIHQDLSLAEQNAISAQSLLDSWKKDTLNKDSIMLVVNYRFAHAYIHKKDGLKTFRCITVFRDHAEQNKILALKILAIQCLAQLYFEWDGQDKKAFPWLEKEYAYFKNGRDFNNQIRSVFNLAMLHARFGNKEEAAKYIGETEKLVDSLNINSNIQYYILNTKSAAGLVTEKKRIEIFDNDFNGRLYLPAAMKADAKIDFYLYTNHQQLDSAWRYLNLAKKLGSDINGKLVNYYFAKKDYDKAILLLKEQVKIHEKQGDILPVQRDYNKLSRAYMELGQYKEAYEYQKKSYQLKDSLNKLLSEVEVAEMGMQKQQEIQEAAYNEQKRQQEEEKRRTVLQNNIRLYGLLAGVAILILIASILWRNNHRKQKDKLKIEQAFNELKLTQAHLIQTEKMASLGELTAGIAHEIQNPLNFVNNFSDVNRELVDELQQELKAGKVDDAIAISSDIKDNEEKINHHGKRADAIVKNMLQHSRSSSGQKEPTDINALADEYLRLSYHGLRAKDKSFNADFKTDFDNSIGKINIIPQDIGRVVLNLINNAFYAVDEKKKLNSNGYEPSVSVSTKKNSGKVEISVKDNGNGIPQKVLDKIFQPFFTTKPTGQGTGLGLSLSYDIIKSHNGEIKVNTKEGEGSEFVISLPVK